MGRKAGALALLLLLIPSVAYAADVGCGRDTDNNGSVDTLCSGQDKDRDGYNSGVDCNDSDWSIFPGASTHEGCNAGQWRTCKADGSGWTACQSTPYCPQGDYTTHSGKEALTCYYIDPVSGSNSTGDGSYGNPWQSLRKISYHLGGKEPVYSLHTPVAGDAFILLGGNHAEDWDNGAYGYNSYTCRNNTNGTSTNPIWIIGDPSSSSQPVLNHTGQGNTFYMLGCDNQIIWDLEFAGNATQYASAFDIAGDVSATDSLDIARNYIHSFESDCSTYNTAAMHFHDGPTNTKVHHNRMYDNYERPGGSGYSAGDEYHGNCPNIMWFNGQGNEITHNIISSSSRSYGGGIRVKHGSYTDDITITHNYIFDVNSKGVALSMPNSTVAYNYFTRCQDWLFVGDSGGVSFQKDITIENNTADDCGGTGINPQARYNIDGSAAADACSGTGTIENIVLRYNIISYPKASPATDSRIYNFHAYGPEFLYNETFVTGGGELTSDYNCFYNSAGDVTFGAFEVNNADTSCGGRASGASYASLADWTTAFPTLDVNSVVVDPQLSSAGIPATAACEGWGYLGTVSAGSPTFSSEGPPNYQFNSGEFLEFLWH